jgi:hypothetical protein
LASLTPAGAFEIRDAGPLGHATPCFAMHVNNALNFNCAGVSFFFPAFVLVVTLVVVFPPWLPTE